MTVNTVNDFIDDSSYNQIADIKVNDVIANILNVDKDLKDDIQTKLSNLQSNINSLIHTINTKIGDIEKLNQMYNISIMNV